MLGYFKPSPAALLYPSLQSPRMLVKKLATSCDHSAYPLVTSSRLFPPLQKIILHNKNGYIETFYKTNKPI
jgi:hypothetical protein